jgi:hypothetical protein
LYAVVGTVAAIVGYGILRWLLGYAPQRSLEGMIVFFDLVVYTGLAFAVSGLAAGTVASRADAPLVGIVTGAVVALAAALALAPNSVARLPYAGGLAVGALIAGGIAAAVGLLRPVGVTGRRR